jgi:hypothetical protein
LSTLYIRLSFNWTCVVRHPMHKIGMSIRLTKHEIGWFRRGPDPETGTIFLYRVEGLPAGQEASIAEFPYRGWRILRWKDGHPGVWYGEYESADQALSRLEQQLEFEMSSTDPVSAG